MHDMKGQTTMSPFNRRNFIKTAGLTALSATTAVNTSSFAFSNISSDEKESKLFPDVLIGKSNFNPEQIKKELSLSETHDARDIILRAAWNDNQGRFALGKLIAENLQTALNFHSIPRKVFKRIDVHESPEHHGFKTFEMGVYPQIDTSKLEQHIFGMTDKMELKSMHHMKDIETKEFSCFLDQQQHRFTQKNIHPKKNVFCTYFEELLETYAYSSSSENTEGIPTSVAIMSLENFKKIRKSHFFEGLIKTSKRNVLNESDFGYTIYSADYDPDYKVKMLFLASTKFLSNDIYLCDIGFTNQDDKWDSLLLSPPDHVGEIVTKQPLTALPADPMPSRKGYVIYEDIGWNITKPNKIQVIKEIS